MLDLRRQIRELREQLQNEANRSIRKNDLSLGIAALGGIDALDRLENRLNLDQGGPPGGLEDSTPRGGLDSRGPLQEEVPMSNPLAAVRLAIGPVFQGEEMICIRCGRQELSHPEQETAWRAIDLDDFRVYVCPACYPSHEAPDPEFTRAYLEILRRALELISLVLRQNGGRPCRSH